MNRFTIHENIRRFQALLRRTVDPDRRRTIEQLLAAEEDMLAQEQTPQRHDERPQS